MFLFIKFPFCHLQYLDGIKDGTIRLNTKSKTQDNKNTFIQQKETKWKANSRKKNKNFSKSSLESRNKNKNKKGVLLKMLSTKTVTSQSKQARNTFCKFVPNKEWKLNKKQMCSKGLSTMEGSKERFGSKDRKRSKERFQESIKMTTLMKQRSNRS